MTSRNIDLWSITPPAVAYVALGGDDVDRALWGWRGSKPSDAFVGVLRGARMKRRESLFDQFGALLAFPSYFGENWNAFDDCMGDLEWLRATAYLLLIRDSEAVLTDAGTGAFSLLLDMLRKAAASWAEPDQFRPAAPFHVLLQVAPERVDLLRARLFDCGEVPEVTIDAEGRVSFVGPEPTTF